MAIQTISQLRAAHALAFVRNQAVSKQAKDLAELRSRANDLPALIHSIGLGQAMALYKAKGRYAHTALYDNLQEWLCNEGRPYAGYPDLLIGITTADAAAYRTAQAEAQALLLWVKQFARAYIAEATPGESAPEPSDA